MGLRAEAWARPGAATFGRIETDLQPLTIGGTVRLSGHGDGLLTLPDIPATAAAADRLQLTDPDTPANSTRALIRVYSDRQPYPPVHEWRVDAVVPPADDQTGEWTVTGLDMTSVIGDAEVYPWDWDGSADFVSRWPDWIYGGRNLVGDVEGRYEPAVVRVWTTATGGTFTLDVDIDGGGFLGPTVPLAPTATSTDVAAALEALVGVVDVEVQGDGTVGAPWRIQSRDPTGVYTFIINSGSLTGGSGFITVESVGRFLPVGWTESNSKITGFLHGDNLEFYATQGGGVDPPAPACLPAGGWFVAFNGTERDFPGVQRVLAVKPGGIYQASVWLYSQGTSTVLRFVMRDLNEGGVAANPGFDSGVTIPANTWTQVTIPNVQIPTDMTQMIYRVGHVGPGDPPRVYVACPEFREGLPAATIGGILGQLYSDATVDHVADGRLVWEDEANPGSPWLTLDFDPVNDSAGQPWADPEVSITAKRGWSYAQFMREIITRLGYETQVIPDPLIDGAWLWQMFNPGTLGTDLSTDDFIGIVAGRDVTRRSLRRYTPPGTSWTVEGQDQRFSFRTDTAAETALGRIENYTPAQDLGTTVETGLEAAETVSRALRQGKSYAPVLRPGSDEPEPLYHYTVGDIIRVDDPPELAGEPRRVVAVTYTATPGVGVEYQPKLSSESFVGDEAVAVGVRQLLERAEVIRRTPPSDEAELVAALAGAGEWPFSVATDNSPDVWKNVATRVGDGINDEAEIQDVLELARSSGEFPTVWFASGNYDIQFDLSRVDAQGTPYGVTVPPGVSLQGPAGPYVIGAQLQAWYPGGTLPARTGTGLNFPRGAAVRLEGSSKVARLAVSAVNSLGDGIWIGNTFGNVVVEDCHISFVRYAVSHWGGVILWVQRNVFEQLDHGAVLLASRSQTSVAHIVDNWVQSTGGAGTSTIVDGLSYGNPNGSNVLVAHIRGNTLNRAGAHAVHLTTPQQIWVVYNKISITGWGTAVGHGVFFAGDPAVSTIRDNHFDGVASDAVRLAATTSGTNHKIVRNTVNDSGNHGIFLQNISQSHVVGNQMPGGGSATPNTYDGIHLAGNSDDNYLTSNTPWTGQFRYGINIAAATCDRNIVVGNQLNRPGGYGTGPLNNAGTGTLLTFPGGAIGDNF